MGIKEDHIAKYYKKIIRKNYKNLKIDNNKNFSESLSEAKMIITTYNSTVLLESIYLDVPIVAMWKKDQFYFNAKSKKYFNFLEKSKILQNDTKKGLKFIKGISTDPLSWWNNMNTVSNLEKFSNHFCNKFFL